MIIVNNNLIWYSPPFSTIHAFKLVITFIHTGEEPSIVLGVIQSECVEDNHAILNCCFCETLQHQKIDKQKLKAVLTLLQKYVPSKVKTQILKLKEFIVFWFPRSERKLVTLCFLLSLWYSNKLCYFISNLIKKVVTIEHLGALYTCIFYFDSPTLQF